MKAASAAGHLHAGGGGEAVADEEDDGGRRRLFVFHGTVRPPPHPALSPFGGEGIEAARSPFGGEGIWRASWRACQMRAGVAGPSRSTTLNSDSASSIALTMAAAPGMAPLSPTPLTPSGLMTDRCSVSATDMDGTSSHLGMA